MAPTGVSQNSPYPATQGGVIPATPHGPDVPAMDPPTGLQGGRPMMQPTLAAPETMYPDAKAPQVLTEKNDATADLSIVADTITGGHRVVTVLAPSVERAIGNDARMLAWNQRMQGGWAHAGIEALDYYPVDQQGQLITDRYKKGPFFYHSRWKLTLTG